MRRATRRGVVVRLAPFDDDLVSGVYRIYNESPGTSGRRFWHFGKDFETVKRGLATYPDRSEFIGAYWNEELIGFIKLVYVDQLATLMHIISMNQHSIKADERIARKSGRALASKRDLTSRLWTNSFMAITDRARSSSSNGETASSRLISPDITFR